MAAILFVGAVTSNLVASELETSLKPYSRWVWMFFMLALIVAVAAAIIEARRRAYPLSNPPSSTVHSAITGTTRIVNASAERSVAFSGDVNDNKIVVGDKNIVGSKVYGDIIARDKIIYIYQTASSPANAQHQLRAPVGDFVGRKQEIDTLITALRRDTHACITCIRGMGGIGKTELALLVANRLTNDYPDAQFFLNLQGTDINPRTSEELLAICIRAFLGPEAKLPEDFDRLSQLYCSQLSGKRVLLLLDNAADSAQVRPLLPPAGSALLITSRHSITLPGMTALTLNRLAEDEARELLLEIAPRAEPVAHEICALCGYLPLAIRACGGLLAITPDLDPLDYVSHMQEECNRLERIGREGVENGVEVSFNLSYVRLASEAARVFRFLAVFSATFDAAAEEVVCADAEHVQLSDLVRRSLGALRREHEALSFARPGTIVCRHEVERRRARCWSETFRNALQRRAGRHKRAISGRRRGTAAWSGAL